MCLAEVWGTKPTWALCSLPNSDIVGRTHVELRVPHAWHLMCGCAREKRGSDVAVDSLVTLTPIDHAPRPLGQGLACMAYNLGVWGSTLVQAPCHIM